MDNRAKAMQAGNEAVLGSSRIVLAYGIAVKPDLFVNQVVGHPGRLPAPRARSPRLFAPHPQRAALVILGKIRTQLVGRDMRYEKKNPG